MRLTEARRPEPMNQTSAPSRSANATPGIARAVSGSATSGRYSPQGALSTISGVGFTAVAVADDTVHLGMLAPYAATGGVFFVIQAGLLASRSQRLPIRRLRAGLNRSVDVGWASTSAEGSAASTPF